MAFSALDALATVCTAELQSEKKNANTNRKRTALAAQFEEPGFGDLTMRGLTTVELTPEPCLPNSAPFAPFTVGTAQPSPARPAFVSEPGATVLPLAPASAQKMATPLMRLSPPAAATPLDDAWALPTAKRRGVVSAGGVPAALPMGLGPHYVPSSARSPADVRLLVAPQPSVDVRELGGALGLPERTPLAGRPQPMRALSPAGAAWQHPTALRVSPTGSGASDGPCFLAVGADVSGAAAAVRPAADRRTRSTPCSPSPSPSAAGTDSESEQQLLEDPAACVSRVVQSPSKGGPGLLEKMKLAQVLLTHREALNPEQVQMVVQHLSSVLQSADAQQLARQVAAQQLRPHHQHHQDLADARHQGARQPTSERRLSAAAGCGALPIKVSDEAIAAAAAGLTSAGHGPARGAASSSSSHTHGSEHGEPPRATASSSPTAAAALSRAHPSTALHLAALRLRSVQRCGSHEDEEVVLGRAAAGCGGVARGLLHSNSRECNHNDDVANLCHVLPPRFVSTAASGASSLQSRLPRCSSSELHVHLSAQQLPTPSAPSPAASLSPELQYPQLHSQQQLQHALRWGAREAAPAPAALSLLTAVQLQHARRVGAGVGAGAATGADGYVVISRQGMHRSGVRGAMLGAPEGFSDSKAAPAAGGLGYMLSH
eukprot:XP_001696334.1 predicted protein [Chlamydomonas reinhardtii]